MLVRGKLEQIEYINRVMFQMMSLSECVCVSINYKHYGIICFVIGLQWSICMECHRDFAAICCPS